MARLDAPEHAALIDDLKDQLLIVLIRKLGGEVSIPVEDVDDTGGFVLAMRLDGRTFHFEVRAKQ